MSIKVTPLNYTDHGHLKVKENKTFAHVNKQQVLPLLVHEFSIAGAEMPVVFVKNTKTGEFQAVAIMGFKSGENVFYDQQQWRGSYVPAYATHHPFALAPTEQDPNQLQVVITESSELVSDDAGEALFDQQGKETEYLQNRKTVLGTYYENMQVTQAFTKILQDHQLLQEQSLTIDLNGEKIALNGLYLVDEKALNALSDEDYLGLRKKGFLPSIYAHLGSLHQLKQLAKLKSLT